MLVGAETSLSFIVTVEISSERARVELEKNQHITTIRLFLSVPHKMEVTSLNNCAIHA